MQTIALDSKRSSSRSAINTGVSRSRRLQTIRIREARSKGLNLNSILVPIDFSNASNKLLRYASLIAKKFHSTLTLLYVAEPVSPPDMANSFPSMFSTKDLIKMWKARLEGMAKRNHLEFSNLEVRLGNAFQGIVQAADELEADLIMMASSGRGGFKRALLGTTTERVIRHATCPVLVIPKAARAHLRKIKLRKLLVPIDFSDCSKLALKYAGPLARQGDGAISLLHVMAPVIYRGEGDAAIYFYGRSAVDYMGIEDQMRRGYASKLRAVAKLGVCKGIPVASNVRVGSPAIEILQVARTSKTDLILMSSHGRTGFPHVFLGSVAEKVIRGAHCPVLVVKEAPSRGWATTGR